jgi:uncharacterized membrane protein
MSLIPISPALDRRFENVRWKVGTVAELLRVALVFLLIFGAPYVHLNGLRNSSLFFVGIFGVFKFISIVEGALLVKIFDRLQRTYETIQEVDAKSKEGEIRNSKGEGEGFRS